MDNSSKIKADVVIIGAGAAGLMCASVAASRGRKVVVLEKGNKPAAKLAISGGGRCNFTNLNLTSENYCSGDSAFIEKVLSKFKPKDFVQLLKSHNVPYVEEEEGQLFCKRSSADIVNMLLNECKKGKVEIVCGCEVGVINVSCNDFCIQTTKGLFVSSSLVIATGGISYPQIGATNFGYNIAKKFGHKVAPLLPGLVPLIYGVTEKNRFSKLSGISLPVAIKTSKKIFNGDMLFTHTGLSGPAVLNASLYWKKGEPIEIDLLPDVDIEKKLLSEKKKGRKVFIHNLLSGMMPRRLAEIISDRLGSKSITEYESSDIKDIERVLHSFELYPSDTAGYGKAEVTVGGVDLRDIDPTSMESKKIPKLHFIGELLDVTGEVGGFNLHFAWASGYVAGKSV